MGVSFYASTIIFDNFYGVPQNASALK